MCFSLLYGTNSVYAKCTNEDIGRVKELAKNINVNYEFVGNKDFDMVTQTYSLSFNFHELEGEVYAKNTNNRNMIFFNSSNSFLVSAGTYNFDIYYNGCEGVKVGSISVVLKNFNRYSLREECNSLTEKIDVCDEWFQGDITEDYFMSQVKKYNNNKIGYSFNSFIVKYYFWILGVGLLLILLIIFLVIRNIRKSRLD